MNEKTGDESAVPFRDLYRQLLKQARRTSRESVKRVRSLFHEFPDSLPGTLVEWLELLGTGWLDERRSAPRSNGSQGVVFVSRDPPPAVGLPALVRDRSNRGIGLLMEKGTDVGSTLWVWSEDHPDGAGWLPAEVRYCQPEGTCWVLGCKFVRVGEAK